MEKVHFQFYDKGHSDLCVCVRACVRGKGTNKEIPSFSSTLLDRGEM